MEVNSIAEKLFFTTVRIDTLDKDGVPGSGTGFLFSHSYQGKNWPFVVTNKHVVAESVKGGITFIQGKDNKPSLGDSYRINFDNFPSYWHGHSDTDTDITITPLIPLLEFMKAQGVNVFYRTVRTENLPLPAQELALDALEEVVFVGYPNGIWDAKNFTPILRKGITATPIGIDYEDKPIFLIDASVFGGSSGSPVFIYQSGTYGTKDGNAMVGTKFFFIGVVAAVYYKTNVNEIISLPIPTQNKQVAIDNEMIDLGIVFKSRTVIETVEAFISKST